MQKIVYEIKIKDLKFNHFIDCDKNKPTHNSNQLVREHRESQLQDGTRHISASQLIVPHNFFPRQRFDLYTLSLASMVTIFLPYPINTPKKSVTKYQYFSCFTSNRSIPEGDQV